MCCCSCWPPAPPERVQGGEKWGTLCSRKTGRTGLQIDNLKSWFYEFYEPAIVSPHIEESTDTLHSGDCLLMTSRSLTDQQKLSTKKKKKCLIAHTWCILSCVLTLCSPRDCSPPGSSVHGILQARILEWVAITSSRGSSQPGDWTHVFCASLTFQIDSLPLSHHLGSPDCMYSPFSKITYIHTVLAPHLFRGASQSYLGCCLLDCTPHFAPQKLNWKVSGYAFFFFFKSIGCITVSDVPYTPRSEISHHYWDMLCFTPKLFFSTYLTGKLLLMPQCPGPASSSVVCSSVAPGKPDCSCGLPLPFTHLEPDPYHVLCLPANLGHSTAVAPSVWHTEGASSMFVLQIIDWK